MKSHHILILLLLAGLMASWFLGFTPLLLSAIYGLFSLLCFWQYARDKKAAMKDEWRVPEDTLHLLSLCGGWPGALLAQERYRHKTTKRSFRVVFWLTVLLNIAAVGWLHTPEGNARLHIGMRIVGDAADRYLPSGKVVTAIHVLTGFVQ
jgi:uncharacterized membrane protein YsdA (DUF1294 family)